MRPSAATSTRLDPPDICEQETMAILRAIQDWQTDALLDKPKLSLGALILDVVRGFNQHRDNLANEYWRIANDLLATHSMSLPNIQDLLKEPELAAAPACGIDCQAGCARGYSTTDECFNNGRKWPR